MDAAELCTHNFAHHVMESILENGEDGQSAPWDHGDYNVWRGGAGLCDLALRFCSSIPSRPGWILMDIDAY